MRGLAERSSGGMELSISPDTATADGEAASRRRWWAGIGGCHGMWFDVALVLPTSLFVIYLASQARKSVDKLSHGGRSNIMIAYYALLWLVSVLNLLWCLLQGWQCTPDKEFSWNMLSLFTNCGLLLLEVSLIAFLLQENYSSGLDSLARTFAISGAIVAADALLKVIYVFGFGVPLFTTADPSQSRAKWGLLVFHKLLLTGVYGFILYMHHSKWKERLPARPAYYNYICAMLLLNSISLFGCLLLGNGAGFGIWLYNLALVCYHSLYLPLLYVTFLADFFQEDDLRLENVYYSEMKDAGFFADDWD